MCIVSVSRIRTSSSAVPCICICIYSSVPVTNKFIFALLTWGLRGRARFSSPAANTGPRFRVSTDDATVVVTSPTKKKKRSATSVSHADGTDADSVSTNSPHYSCCGRWRLACTVSSRAMWPACVTYFCGPPPWQLATKDPLSRGSDEGLWWVICMRL